MKFEKRLAGRGFLKRASLAVYHSRWYQRMIACGKVSKEQLMLLHPGGKPQEVLEEYHCRKIAEALLGIGLVLLLAAAGTVMLFVQKKGSRIQWVDRPGYQEAGREAVWKLEREDGTTQDVHLAISEREYTREEVEAKLEAAAGELDELILGENASADRIEYPLVLPETAQEGEVTLQWVSEQPEIISSKGIIAEDYLNEEGTLVELRAVLTCQNREAAYLRNFRVYPAIREEEALFYAKVQDALRTTEQESREEEGFALPESIDGENVVFREKAGQELFLLAGLALLAVLLLYAARHEKISREAALRRDQLLADYPELVSKLSVLLRAGLTARAAFGKITADYRRRREQEGMFRYAYEELMITYYEIANGVPESRAYEQYGKRCGLLPYMRLGGLLAQNVRKGNKSLLLLLNQEAAEAFEERKKRARKAGEKAGTRMLMPMILMLVVTILIVLYPAFSSFYV